MDKIKKIGYLEKGVEPNYLNLLFTSVPTMLIIILFLVIKNKNLWLLLFPFGVFGLLILKKPLEKCEFCGKPIKHKIQGLFDLHIQCGCIENRWRPIWHLWAENIHNRIFRKF